MNNLLPTALTNTVLLADHDEATQRAVVDAVEKIVYHYLQQNLQRNMDTVAAYLLSSHTPELERLALRALKTHLNNASNIY